MPLALGCSHVMESTSKMCRSFNATEAYAQLAAAADNLLPCLAAARFDSDADAQHSCAECARVQAAAQVAADAAIASHCNLSRPLTDGGSGARALHLSCAPAEGGAAKARRNPRGAGLSTECRPTVQMAPAAAGAGGASFPAGCRQYVATYAREKFGGAVAAGSAVRLPSLLSSWAASRGVAPCARSRLGERSHHSLWEPRRQPADQAILGSKSGRV